MSKVARVIETYELTGLGAELEARWTDDTGSRTGLRDLADLFNRRVLQAAMEDAGLAPLESEVRNKYETLTDDDTSSGVRTQIRRELERNGVDVETVEECFVTHQSMHTYLTEHRGATLKSETDSERFETVRETIQRLKRRTVVVVEEKLARLRRHDLLSTGELTVVVDVRVTCTDCGSQYDITTLLEERNCDCDYRD